MILDFSQDLMLLHFSRDRYAMKFDGTQYYPTHDTTFAGALIFALNPRRVVADGSRGAESFRLMASIATAQLRGHVRGRSIPEWALERWRDGAIALARTARDAAAVMWQIDEALKLRHRQAFYCG
jgi:hypothetical protein